MILCPVTKKSSACRQISLKVPNIKCHENPCSGNRVVCCGRTDRHNGDSSRFSYLRMYIKMCTGAEHTATTPCTFIARYRDSLTFTNTLTITSILSTLGSSPTTLSHFLVSPAAMAAPMPLPAPVTTATRPAQRSI